MVRAAAAGALDYSRADPRDRSWLLRQRFILLELARKESHDFLTLVHAHWCAYASKDNLTEEGRKTVKTNLDKTLKTIEDITFPRDAEITPTQPAAVKTQQKQVPDKIQREPKKDTILDKDTADLIKKYREMQEKGQI